MNIKHTSRNVCTVHFDNISAGWEFWLLNTSDRHHDSVFCDRKLEKQHLDEVVERNGMVADYGDFFDAMQGRFDPRRSFADLRPEYAREDYLDFVIKDAANFYAPYAKHFLMIGKGNHEQSVLKHNGVDLVGNLVHRLNSDHGGNIQSGGYGGYIRFLFNSGKKTSKNLKYFHGAGGGGPVTKGVIQSNRQAVIYPDADIVINGHIHEAWHVAIKREHISNKGVVYTEIQHHIRTATYKDEWQDGFDGFMVERGNTPKPVGAYWIRFFYHSGRIETEILSAVK